MVMVTTPDIKTDCEQGHYHQTSVADLTNALVAEWEKILAVKFLNVVERLKPGDGYRLLYTVIAAD